MPAIQDNNSGTFYGIVFFLAITYIVIVIVLLVYTIFSIAYKKFYFYWPLDLLKIALTFLQWILFIPFFEVFLVAFSCVGGYHIIDTSLQCYQGFHIVYVVLSSIFMVFLFSITILTAVFTNETQHIPENAFAR